MDNPRDLYDATFNGLVAEAASFDLQTEAATTAMQNLERFSKCRPPEPTPEIVPDPDPVPLTGWEKVRCSVASALDNETTRTGIKAIGAFAGVALIAWATIHKDHVIERQALSQANQRNS